MSRRKSYSRRTDRKRQKAECTSQDQILKFLDHHAKEFSFPMFDIISFNAAYSRLSVYKNEEQWLIIFEMIGAGAGYIENCLFAYGNKTKQDGIISSFNDIYDSDDDTYYDDDGHLIIDPFNINVSLNNEKVHLTLSKDDYERNHIENPELFNHTKLVRILCAYYPEKFLLKEKDIFEEVELENIPLFYRTESWQHPALTEDELPSDIPFFRSLALAIENGDSTLIENCNPNNHWTNWIEDDVEEF
jgi:hypothetical protein